MKKFIISIIILLIFSGAGFILGWLEFFVPVDKYGVLITKTGGVHSEVIKAGNFTWSWERLLPTNSTLRVFSATPTLYSKNIQGSLPSADIYKNMLEGAPNFSYSFSVDILMNIKPEELPMYIYKTGTEDQATLDTSLDRYAELIAREVIQYVIENSVENNDFVIDASLSQTKLIEGIDANNKFSNLDIISITINNITLPDITMYNFAKNSYAVYQEAIQATLDHAVEFQGAQAAQDYLELERLAKLGRVLEEYPSLIEYKAVSNDIDFLVE